MTVHSENAILTMLDELFPRSHPSLRLGRGDDCAELAPCGPLAVSCDLFLEDVHFRRGYFMPEEIGAKALAVNVSDLASAGAVPVGFSLALMCPSALNETYLKRTLAGMAGMARQCGIPLCGGDISAAPALGFNITVFGKGVAMKEMPGATTGEANGLPFLHRGAQLGDIIFFVTPSYRDGSLAVGLARTGLIVLEQRGRAAEAVYPEACAALLAPRPMLEAGQALARLSAWFTGQGEVPVRCMDVSDGLARDIPRLLGEGVHVFSAEGETAAECGISFSCCLDFALEALHPEVQAYVKEHIAALTSDSAQTLQRHAARSGLSAHDAFLLRHVLIGGDEYGLLCACESGQWAAVRSVLTGLPGVSWARLGHVDARPGIRWQGHDMTELLQGAAFDHFSGGKA